MNGMVTGTNSRLQMVKPRNVWSCGRKQRCWKVSELSHEMRLSSGVRLGASSHYVSYLKRHFSIRAFTWR